MYGENAPPSWARLPGARCRAVEHLTKLDGFKEFELLDGLEEGFFQALAIAAEVLELGAGTALYREGEPSGAVYFMREGRVKLYRSSGGPKARDQILGVVGDGSVLGLGASLEGRTQSQGATALTDCVLYAVFRDDLF
jgi:CRP/FNR family transcriptional regulator, cyclic AMP receptor protein